MAEILRVREAFAYTLNGISLVAAAGKLFDASDPAVKGREKYFEPVSDVVNRAVLPAHSFTETASAAPGEARSRRRITRKSDDTTPEGDE